MSNHKPLNEKVCIPCSGGIPPLTKNETTKLLDKLDNGWQLNKEGHLYKTFIVRDFLQAMEYAQRIADIAEEQNHHPNLELSFGQCAVEIWTHKINGLTESDFILGAKIDMIANG